MGEGRGEKGPSMTSIITVIIVFSILIIIHEFGHFIMAKKCGVKVEKFSLGFGPKIAGIKRGGTEYVISAVPLGGYVKLAGETYQDGPTGAGWEFLSKNPWERFQIVAFGPFLNYMLGFLLFSITFMIGAPALTNKVGKVLDGYPAKAAGVMPGDRIVSIDGREVKGWNELTRMMHKKFKGPARISILRNGRSLELDIRPKVKANKDIFGNEVKIALIGIAPSDEVLFVKYGPVGSVYKGASKVFELTVVTFKALWSLITGRIRLRESVSGPIGIFVLTARAARMGFVYLLNVMAIISTSLAIFNLLPVPVLDGGHIIFLAVEKLRNKPLSPKVQETASRIGFSILILLMIFVFYFDILRLLGR